MRLGGVAAYLSEVNEHSEVPELVAWAKQRQLPIIVIGDGTNIVWRDEGFPGLIIVNRLMRFETYNSDDTTLYLTAGSGENWDSVVERSVTMGYSGLAELSLIPGTTGATPVQNVGAYGRELSDTLVTVEAYDIGAEKFITMPASDCNFGYRTSRFKTTDTGKFLITALTVLLSKTKPTPPYYDAVQAYLTEHAIAEPAVTDIRDAVIAIRRAKLPDPAVVANNGSFFSNPIIDTDRFRSILEDNPTMRYWHLEDGTVKLSAAWLLEQAGFKNFHDQETGMATWPTQPLVLVNEHAHSTADLLAFKQKILDAVQAKFGITLAQEPELLPRINQ